MFAELKQLILDTLRPFALTANVLITDGKNTYGFNLWKHLLDRGFDVTAILPRKVGDADHISEVYSKREVKYDYVINTIYSCDLNASIYGKVSEAFNRLLIKFFPDSKLIMLSADAVYRSSNRTKKEDFSIRPETPYGRAMAGSEKTASEMKDSAIIRTGIIVGRCSRNLLTSSLAAIRSSTNIALYSNVVRAFVKNTDLSFYTEFIMSHDLSGPYNIAGDNMTPFDFGKFVCSNVQKCTVVPSRYSISNMDFSIDSSKIENLSGRKPESVLSMLDINDYEIGA
ncbi:MAG: hypothetical protein ACP5UV_02635 [Thermoplasmata archaeon]